MPFEHGFTLVDLVEPDALREVCAGFHDLFRVSIRVFGQDGTLIADAAAEDAYCGYIRGFPGGRRRCHQWRAEVKRGEPSRPGETSFRCFSGCAYEVMPVQFQGDAMGKMVFGPYLPAEVTRLPAELLQIDPAIDQQTLAEAAASMRRIPRDTIERIVRAFLAVLELILHSGYRAATISEAHIMAVQESYRELAETTKALQVTTERLQEMDRLKSNFMAAVSHELRTPLTSIIGYSEMLAQGMGGALSGEQRQFVQTILEKGEHLLGLISSVIDLSTLDAGRMTLRRELVDVGALCDRAVEKVQAQSPRRDVRIRRSAADAVPQVRVDPEMIEKALTHLVENAVKFSPPSGVVSIEVRLVELEADKEAPVGFVLLAPLRRYVGVSVTDSGPGVPEAERERIFEAFYQTDGSATRVHGGLGLGLALVRQFALVHGGRVDVESGPGGGSVFRLLLPVPVGEATD